MKIKELLSDRLITTKPPDIDPFSIMKIMVELCNDKEFMSGESILICTNDQIRVVDKNFPVKVIFKELFDK